MVSPYANNSIIASDLRRLGNIRLDLWKKSGVRKNKRHVTEFIAAERLTRPERGHMNGVEFFATFLSAWLIGWVLAWAVFS